MTQTQPLSEGWTLTASTSAPGAPAALHGRRVPAAVPGTVHTDLLAAGLIDDPYLDRNEADLAWIGSSTWRFDTTFTTDAVRDGERVELVCHGLDTVAEVAVNGRVLGRTRNMHRSYRFDVTEALRDGDNDLRVVFTPADAEAERLRDELGDLPCSYTHPYNFIRKMACNFGWDWGPDLTTAGIWRPIELHRWRTARFDRVRPMVTVDGTTGVVRLVVDVARHRSGPLRLVATVAGQRVEAEVPDDATTAEVTLQVPDVRRWWPYGEGEQPRYDVAAQLLDGDAVLDEWTRAVGFRSVRLDTTPDDGGTRFALEINDAPLFVRGVNWIPEDCFPHRVDRERYRRRLVDARDAGVNLIRVWGGGIFETREFYELCDELGLLVWQDFLFACAAYPEEQPLRDEVAAESAEAVARLMPHPSLVLWNGCNENIWAQQDWGWGPGTQGRTWGLGYYLDLLPAIVAEVDPTRPYWPGSPYSTDGVHPNDPDHGTAHLWGVWNDLDYVHYRDSVPRFVGEFGYQGPAAYATLRRAISDEPLTPGSPGMLAHQKADRGAEKLDFGLAAHFGVPTDFDDWHYLASVNQARAVELGISHFRSHRGRCMGTVLWQLNDCWPVVSWAVVDGDERRKPAWYALRRAYARRLLTVAPRDGRPAVVAVNDDQDVWKVPLRITRRRLADGVVLADQRVDLSAAAGAATTVELDAQVATPADPAGEMLVADADGGARALWFFLPDRELRYPQPRFDTTVRAVDGGYRVVVHAHTLLRDLTIFPDRLHPAATVDEALLTLLPGESATFTVDTPEALPTDQLVTAPVLRCVNDRQLPAGG